MKIKFYSALIISFVLFSVIKAQVNNFSIRTGVNVSHWLSQSEARGDARRNYIIEKDFQIIAGEGFDHVRIPIDEVQMWDDDGNKHSEAFELLHNAINWAFKNNLRVIVDLHIIRSHYFNAESNELWTNPAEQEKLIGMWYQLSDELIKYSNDKLAYEVLNEAVAKNPEDWNNLLNKIITAIRKREPRRTIVAGSNMWQTAGTFPDLKIPENDPNILLSFHFYTPMAITHHKAPWTQIAGYDGPVNYPGVVVDTTYLKTLPQKTIDAVINSGIGPYDKQALKKIMQPAFDAAKKYNLPLYCGEFGVYPTIPEEISLRWYKDIVEILNENNTAYSHWCYRGDFPIVNDKREPNKKLTSVLTSK